MADARLRHLSLVLLALVAVLAVAADIALVRSGEALIPVLFWAAMIGVAHAVTIPTPSGKPANAAVVPAIAAAVLLPATVPVLAAIASGLIVGWIVVRSRARNRSGADSGYAADAVSLVALGLVTPVLLEALTGSPLSQSWQRLAAITGGALVWFVVRALISTWVGVEREHLSTRYLWLLALEDWTVALVLVTTGSLFVVTLDAMGVWSVVLAAMTYALGYLALLRVNQSRSTYVQMIRALAQISEIADLAPRGHSVRTAELAVAVAREMGLRPDDVVDLEYAALMHDVGRITLTEPALTSAGYTDDDIARRGAEIIAEAPHLDAVAGYVRMQHHPYRRPGEATDPDVPTVSKIIKVASAYDQAVHEMHMSPLEALERIHRGSAYDFDPTVAASLRRVLVRRRVVAA